MGRVNRAILIYCVVKSIIFSATPEEVYIELEMKGQKNEFYRVLIDEETEKMYIGVGEFIDFARMDEVKFDKKRMRVKGKLDAEREIDIKIPKKSSIETEDDIFIELDEFKRYFFIPESNWDNERYILNLYPEFKTSKESQDELNNQRSLLKRRGSWRLREII